MVLSIKPGQALLRFAIVSCALLTPEGKASHGDDLAHVVDNTVDNMELQTKMKQRDEGVVPAVHAFNALRVAFHDTNLATDTSGFCAQVLITAIQAFLCSYWEVRNSATRVRSSCAPYHRVPECVQTGVCKASHYGF